MTVNNCDYTVWTPLSIYMQHINFEYVICVCIVKHSHYKCRILKPQSHISCRVCTIKVWIGKWQFRRNTSLHPCLTIHWSCGKMTHPSPCYGISWTFNAKLKIATILKCISGLLTPRRTSHVLSMAIPHTSYIFTNMTAHTFCVTQWCVKYLHDNLEVDVRQCTLSLLPGKHWYYS